MKKLMLMWLIRPFISVIVLFVSFTIAYADHPNPDDVYLNRLNYCKLSKATINDYEPESFCTSNNMLRRSGGREIVCGTKIIVRGVLLDQNCAPISDAKIYAWQVSCDGKYAYKPLKDSIQKHLISINPSNSFIGHGTATTNNKGEFFLITIMPKEVHGLGPHINIRAEHFRIGKFQTSLMINDHAKKTGSEPELVKISSIARNMNAQIYDFQVVILGKGVSKY